MNRQLWTSRWRNGLWLLGAGLIATVFSVVSVVDFLGADMESLYERFLEVALLVVAAAVILGGLVARTRSRRLGSTLIAVGSLPGAAAIALYWHPGFLMVGVLSIAVITTALSEARSEQSGLVGG